jgi:hypothetical protein
MVDYVTVAQCSSKLREAVNRPFSTNLHLTEAGIKFGAAPAFLSMLTLVALTRYMFLIFTGRLSEDA